MSASAPPGPSSTHVELLVAFANSEDHELGTDDLTTAAGLSRWLGEHHLLAGGRASAADLELARRLRDGLHGAFAAHHDGRDDDAALVAASRELPLRLAAPSGPPDSGPPGLAPVETGVRGALSELAVAVSRAVGDGSWHRLKICAADDCRWAYYDASKNRSRAWCEWGCGNKAKTRSYRARQKAAHS